MTGLSHSAEITVQRFVRAWDRHLQGAHELLALPQQGHPKAYCFQPTNTPKVCWPGTAGLSFHEHCRLCVHENVFVCICVYV